MLDYLAMLPVAFPGIVLAVGMLHIWITPPLVLYGTIWILFVAYLTRYLPYGVRSTSATLVQIHPELERSEEHTSELQSLMRISYAVFCLKKKTITKHKYHIKIANYI